MNAELIRSKSAGLLGVMTLVLLTGCVSQKRIVAKQAASIDSLRLSYTRVSRERDALQDSLLFYGDVRSGQYFRDMRVLRDSTNLLDYRLAVCRDGGERIATFQSDDLFVPGDVALTPEGARLLDAFAEILKNSYARRSFRVEGHADNTPLGPRLKKRFAGNWELSTARAASVARYLSTAARIPSENFEIVGFGESHPIARNDTEVGRSLNRRVHIAVVPDFTVHR